MKQMVEELNHWLEELEENKLPSYEDLPDVTLYMDQIVSYIDTILKPYSKEEQKVITSFMVNNYVKAKIIDAPHLKRYAKNQLAYLIAVCLLKQSTTMTNLVILLNKNNFQDSGKLYDHFVSLQESAKSNISAKTKQNLDKILKGESLDKANKSNKKNKKEDNDELVSENDQIKETLIDLALRLMIESEMEKIVAERILYEIGRETYKNPNLFEENSKEVKFESKKAKKEAKRLKRVKVKES